MMTLLLLLLAVGATASLVAAATFLYRFLVRSRLFPQLPRIWGADKKRAIIFGGAALALLIGFVATSLTTRPAPGPEGPEATANAPVAPGEQPLGPSFDGQPPPGLTPPLTHMAQAGPGQEGAASPPEPPAEAGQPAPSGMPGGLPGGLPGGPTPGEERPQAKAAPAPAPAPAQEPAKEPAKAEPAKAEPVKAEAPQPEPAKATPAKTEPAKPEPAKSEPAKTEPVKTEPVKAEPPAPAEPAKAEPTAEKPKAALAGPYTVCLSSHKQKDSAEAEAAKLAKRGVEATVVAVDLGPKGHWFRVCAGQFKEPAQAQAQAREWKKQGVSSDPFLARLP